MAEDKRHILVVCGYGCHLDTPLRPYLDRVFRFIQTYHPNTVIFCGGFTQNKTAPGVSEAGLMREYTRADQFPEFMLKSFTEDESYTTFDNIKNASEIIRHKLCIADGRITIFCEATRSPHVIRIARHFMSDLVDSIDDITVETSSWERDVNLLNLAWKYILAELAIRYPWLGIAERERQRRLLRSKEI